jgi:hypothetical protein
MPPGIGTAAATCGSGVAVASSVVLAWGGARGGDAEAAGGSMETVGSEGAATGRGPGCGAGSIVAHPASARTHRFAAKSATGAHAPLRRGRTSTSVSAGGAGEHNGAHRFVFMAGGREYNTKRHTREIDMISDRVFRCP